MANPDSDVLKTTPQHGWIGYVAADKDKDSISIEVLIPELRPSASGSVSPVTQQQSVNLTNIGGGSVNSNVTTGNTITCYYRGNDTNRKYPPDVVKGEQVHVYRIGNADKYWWESLGRDDNLRMTETHRMEVKNRKQFSDSTGDDNTYSIELDTKRAKHIRLRTSKGTGEKYQYQLWLDAKGNMITLADDVGNSCTIDSANTKVLVRNAKNAFMLLNGEDGTFAVPRDMTIKAGRQVLVTIPLISVTAKGGSNVIALSGNAISQTASSVITATAPTIGLMGIVAVPTTIVVNLLLYASMATGTAPATIPSPSIDLGSASAKNSSASKPDTSTGEERETTAWPDYMKAIEAINECFLSIEAEIGVPVAAQLIPITLNSTLAKMSVTKGT